MTVTRAMNDKLILIVEDEEKLAALHRDYLQQANFRTKILYDGRNVIDTVKQTNPDLILLDLMLPGRDGMDICRELITFSTTPIIMVTARVEEIDRLLGLEIGADDYICKPFSPREVVARVKSVLRRSQQHTEQHDKPSRFKLNEERFIASYAGKDFALTPVEFKLLKTLSSQPGRVFSRDVLMTCIYTDNRVVTYRTVDSHIKNLRRKLQELIPDEAIIRSIYGIGYKLDI